MLGSGKYSLALWLASGACSVTTARCLDEHTLEICQESHCTPSPCRGDEFCDGGQCRTWTEAPMSAAFELRYDPAHPLRVDCRVKDGGFPRQLTESIRLSFGDDFSGWGEHSTHTYRAPGVYVVELEVRLQNGTTLRASQLATVGALGPEHVPLSLTLNRVPAYLSGRLPFFSNNATPNDPRDDYESPFALVVPAHGFTVDLTLLERPEALVDRGSLTLVADRDLAHGMLTAGTNLADWLLPSEGDTDQAPRFSWFVDASEAFPTGAVTLTARATTADGTFYEQHLRFEVEHLAPDRAPFDRPLAWLLRFDMDMFATHGRASVPNYVSIDSSPGPDGVADFAAELRTFGAQSDDTAWGANAVFGRGRVGASAVFLAWVKRTIVEEVYRYFHIRPDGTPDDGIAFTIYTDGESGAPNPRDFSPDGSFSMLRMGGALSGYLGRSYYGVYNEKRVDDTANDLGVATGSILDSLVGSAVLTNVFNDIKPGVGIPVGEHELDAVILADDFDRGARGNSSAVNLRYDALANVARFMALGIANITAHEMGHGMGLMPNGPPPFGFFGGRPDITFMGSAHTDSHHADFPPLNLMQAGGNLLSTLHTALTLIEYPPGTTLVERFRGFAYENRLSPYELAYLQGRLTYRNFDGPQTGRTFGCGR